MNDSNLKYPISPLEAALEGLIGKVHAQVKAELQEQLYLRSLPIKVDFFPVVSKLFQGDGLTQQAIANWIGYDRARTSRMLDALEKEGLVERRSDAKSRRTKRIFLTPYARSIREDIEDAVEGAYGKALTGFSEEEQSLLIDMLRRIKFNLKFL